MRPGRRPRLLAFIVVAAFVVALLVTVRSSPAAAAASVPPHVDVLQATGEINPVFASYIERGIAQAERDGAQAVVIEIDTPGGLDTSMRTIVQSIDSSTVPVIVYVYPPGARAASAGLFVTEAAQIAAMAPDTNVGSAHPVGLSSTGQTQPIDPIEEAKVTNDAVALIRGLATSRGRNADWVEQAVRQSVNVGVDQAVTLHVVDLEASSLPALLQKVNGRTVHLLARTVTLHTAQAKVVDLPMTFVEEVWQTLADPTLAYIMMTIGMYALIFEVTHPGAIVPGVAGVVLLVVGLFALGTLSVNLAGLALVVFGFALLVAEVLILPGSGLLAAGGIGSLIMGSLLLSNGSSPENSVAPWASIAVVVVSAGFFAILTRGVLSIARRRPVVGRDAMLGLIGKALENLDPEGQIAVKGEIWQSKLTTGFPKVEKGQQIRVVAINGLRLIVEPVGVPAASKS